MGGINVIIMSDAANAFLDCLSRRASEVETAATEGASAVRIWAPEAQPVRREHIVDVMRERLLPVTEYDELPQLAAVVKQIDAPCEGRFSEAPGRGAFARRRSRTESWS